jgi:hypothetical protein
MFLCANFPRKRENRTANYVQLGSGKSRSNCSCFYNSGYSVRSLDKKEKSLPGQQGLSCGHQTKRLSIMASAQRYRPLYRQDLGISAGTTISSSDMNSFVTFRTRRLHLLGPCLGARPKQNVGSSTSQHLLRPPRVYIEFFEKKGCKVILNFWKVKKCCNFVFDFWKSKKL